MAGGRLSELFDPQHISGSDYVATPPRSLADMMASGTADSASLQPKLDILGRVRPKVDYSDFGNFVFFNSALDYFNLAGERMLNDWPYDGKFSDQLNFQSASDNYQDWLLSQWPRFSGSIILSSGSLISVVDSAIVSGGQQQSAFLQMGSNSWTFEVRVSATNYVTPFSLLRKTVSGGPASVTVTVANNTATLALTDASASSVMLTGALQPVPTGSGYYLAFGIERLQASGTATNAVGLTMYQADFSNNNLPSLIASGSRTLGFFSTGTGGFQVGGMGSFQVGEVRVWSSLHDQNELRANYNTRVYQSDDLALYWRMDDGNSGTLVRPVSSTIMVPGVLDYSGHKLNGLISGPITYVGGGFGMSPQDLGEYILNVRDPQLSTFIQTTQNSATQYDRNNTNVITNLVPQQFFFLEDERNTHVLRDLLYTLSRQFDELKVAIDQLPKLLSVSYTGFDEAPDALLRDVLQFWGWDTKANFLSTEAFQYFFGYNVISGTQAQYDNQRLDIQLYDIKNEFWRRTLQNLAYLYKKKGTKEGVESLFRVYGLDEKIVKLKEYGLKPLVGIQTNRIASEKSAPFLQVTGSQSVDTSPLALTNPSNTGTIQVQMQIKFPSRNEVVSRLSGSVFHLKQLAAGSIITLYQPLYFLLGGSTASFIDSIEELQYARPQPGTFDPITGQFTDTTGSFTMVVQDSLGAIHTASFTGVNVFDGEWYSLTFTREGTSAGSPMPAYELFFNRLDEGDAIEVYASPEPDSASTGSVGPGSFGFGIGPATGSGWTPMGGAEFDVFNAQLWDVDPSQDEVDDHCINPFGQGADTPERYLSMSLNWQFDEGKDANAGGVAHNSTIAGIARDGYFTNPASGTYGRDLFDYNFIAPVEYGWTEDKIRMLDAPGDQKIVVTPEEERWNDSNVVALEFNLMDALNEDISYMLSSMKNWNNVIGEAANRYRDDYPELQRLRQQYFTRLTGRINFRAFADFLDFFDRSFVQLVQKMLPARANFKGAEFVVESHMLERPKVQYTYRRQSPELVPEGDITIYAPDPTPDIKQLRLDVFRTGSWVYQAPETIGPSQFNLSRVTGIELPLTQLALNTILVMSASVFYYDDDANNTGPRTVTWSLGDIGQTWSGSQSSSVATIVTSSNTVFYQTQNAAGYDFLYVNATQDARLWTRVPIVVLSTTLDSIDVVPSSSTGTFGTIAQLHAVGNFTVHPFNTTFSQDITNNVQWSASDPNIGVVVGSGAISSTVNTGSETVTAFSGVISGSASLRFDYVLQSIDINPHATTVDFLTSVQYHATGNYGGGHQSSLDGLVTWYTSDPTIAVITNPGGLASHGAHTGTAGVWANVGLTGSNTATIQFTATLQSIAVTPGPTSSARSPIDTQVIYTGTGNYSDSTTQDVTVPATWTSSNAAAATITSNTASIVP